MFLPKYNFSLFAASEWMVQGVFHLCERSTPRMPWLDHLASEGLSDEFMFYSSC